MGKYDFVLDTSVVVQWYSPEKELHVEKAIELLTKYEKLGFEKIIIPDLLVLELTNALLVGKGLGFSLVEQILGDFYGLGMTIVDVDLQTVALAIKIVKEYKVTIYDAVFLAIAQLHECRLLSDDLKSHGRIKDKRIQMLNEWLDDDLYKAEKEDLKQLTQIQKAIRRVRE